MSASARKSCASSFASRWTRPASAAMRSIMCCSTVRPASAKRRWPTSVLLNWAAPFEAPADRRSRGTPRIVNRLLRRVRDYAEVRHDGVLTVPVVDAALDIWEIDTLGLDSLDRAYLHALIKHYDGGPAGIEAIAASMGHERDTL